MKSKKKAGNFAEVVKLVSEPNSGCRVISHTRHMCLSPRYLGQIKSGIHDTLDAELGRFSDGLQGIPFAYDNVKLLNSFGNILDDSPFIQFDVQYDVVVFRVNVGDHIECCINEVAKDHLSCLIHGQINLSIPLSKLNFQAKNGLKGQKVMTQIYKIRSKHGLLALQGEPTEESLKELQELSKHPVQQPTNSQSSLADDTLENLSSDIQDLTDMEDTRKKKKKKKRKEQYEHTELQDSQEINSALQIVGERMDDEITNANESLRLCGLQNAMQASVSGVSVSNKSLHIPDASKDVPSSSKKSKKKKKTSKDGEDFKVVVKQEPQSAPSDVSGDQSMTSQSDESRSSKHKKKKKKKHSEIECHLVDLSKVKKERISSGENSDFNQSVDLNQSQGSKFKRKEAKTTQDETSPSQTVLTPPPLQTMTKLGPGATSTPGQDDDHGLKKKKKKKSEAVTIKEEILSSDNDNLPNTSHDSKHKKAKTKSKSVSLTETAGGVSLLGISFSPPKLDFSLPIGTPESKSSKKRKIKKEKRDSSDNEDATFQTPLSLIIKKKKRNNSPPFMSNFQNMSNNDRSVLSGDSGIFDEGDSVSKEQDESSKGKKKKVKIKKEKL